MIDEERNKAIKEFEYMRDMAELKALSNISLQRPLNELEYIRIMQLKEILFN